jgi:hypothetical protein
MRVYHGCDIGTDCSDCNGCATGSGHRRMEHFWDAMNITSAEPKTTQLPKKKTMSFEIHLWLPTTMHSISVRTLLYNNVRLRTAVGLEMLLVQPGTIKNPMVHVH